MRACPLRVSRPGRSFEEAGREGPRRSVRSPWTALTVLNTLGVLQVTRQMRSLLWSVTRSPLCTLALWLFSSCGGLDQPQVHGGQGPRVGG